MQSMVTCLGIARKLRVDWMNKGRPLYAQNSTDKQTKRDPIHLVSTSWTDTPTDQVKRVKGEEG